MQTLVRTFALAALAALAPAAPPAGFTEPPLVFYGSVTQSADGYTRPVTAGTLVWTITPASGAAFQLRTSLTPLDGGLSYRLEIPIAKVPAGFSLEPATLTASSTTLTHQRGGLQLDGQPVSIVSPVGPNAGVFTFAETQRGKAERVDLAVVGPFLDSDGDGLPDWWEDLYGLNKYDPSDAGQLDAFGMRTFLQDYQRQVNPLLGSEYEQWAAAQSIPTVLRAPTVDGDGDGQPNALEFALGTDPNLADAGLGRARQTLAREDFNGVSYYTLTVQKPGRQFVGYAVESSSDAVNWSSAEGTAVVTVISTSGVLKVRDAQPAGSGRRFLRLRATLLQ